MSVEVSSDQLGASLAIAAAVLQFAGYAIYFRLTLTGEIEPNPITWIMFAYGTTLLAALEYASGAGWQELLLPITCASCGIAIALTLMLSGKFRYPDAGWETSAFIFDVGLTLGYLWLWQSLQTGMIAREQHDLGVLAFLVTANATTITAFIPILRSTYLRPSHENYLPWVIWTIAYFLLLLATVRNGISASPVLLMYPAIGVVLHASIALLAHHGIGVTGNQLDFRIDETPLKGVGIFAKRSFKKGELVFVMTGQRYYFKSRSKLDAYRYTNWIGVARDEYIDPAPPYLYVNHSCSPNLGIWRQNRFVALRDIERGEELSYDYAITTEEAFWQMNCLCESADCRQTIGSIHSLPQRVFDSYLPYINPYFQKIYRTERASQNSGSGIRSR